MYVHTVVRQDLDQFQIPWSLNIDRPYETLHNKTELTYPRNKKNMIIIPQAMSTSDLDPYPEGQKEGRACEESPQPSVELKRGVDIGVLEVFVVFSTGNHLHIVTGAGM